MHLQPGRRAIPWAIARQAVAAQRARLGDAATDAILARERDAMGLLLRRLPAGGRLAVRETGFLAKSSYARHPLREGVARAMVALCAGGPPLAVHDAAFLDPEDLRWLARVDAVLAWDPATPAPDGVRALAFAEATRALAALPAEDAPGAPASPPPPPRPDPLDDAAEARAWARLAEPGPVGAETVRVVTDAAAAAFRCGGLVGAALLDGALLYREPPLDGPGLARVHTRLSVLLPEHLDAALALETDPARRAPLLARRALRTRNADDAEAAVVEARALGGGLGGWLEAWARHALAYVRMREGRAADALSELEAARSFLEEAEGDEGVPAPELPAARLGFAANTAALHAEAGDLDGAEKWAKEAERREAAFGPPVQGPLRRATLARRRGRLVEALDLARVAAANALGHDPEGEEIARAEAADLCERLGRWKEALPQLERLVALRGDEAGLRAARLGRARARRKLGDAALAEEELRALVAEAPEGPVKGLLLAEYARAAADAGLVEEAGDAADDAVDAALADPIALVRVARLVGETCRALGREDEALRAFAHGLRIAGDTAPASERFLLLVALDDPMEALMLLPAALADAQAWDAVDALHARRDELPEDAGLDDALALLRDAARQRKA